MHLKIGVVDDISFISDTLVEITMKCFVAFFKKK